MKKRVLLLIIFSLLISGCSYKRGGYRLFQNKQVTSTTKPVNSYYRGQIEYKILRNDRVVINIYKYPNLIPADLNKRGILVDRYGKINLPLIGEVRIAGLTQTQARRVLERKYSKYLRYPELNIEAINKRVYVLGEVNKPGPITLDKDYTTVLQALSFAGGLRDRSLKNNIVIVSNTRGGLKMRRVDLTNFNTLKSANLVLRPNDILYVQPNRSKLTRLELEDALAPFNAVSQLLTPFATLKTITE